MGWIPVPSFGSKYNRFTAFRFSSLSSIRMLSKYSLPSRVVKWPAKGWVHTGFPVRAF